MGPKIFQFDDYVLDVAEQRLQKKGEDIQLSPKVFEVLSKLVEHHGHLVTHDELMNAVWKDTFVEETNLRYCIHSLRKILKRHYIETVPKRGYRFTPRVVLNSNDEPPFVTENSDVRAESSKVDSPATKSRSSTRRLVAFTTAFLLLGATLFYLWQSGISRATDEGRTLTVIPFSVVGDDAKNQERLKQGLLHSLVFNLGRISNLRVTAANEIRDFSDSDAINLGLKYGAEMVLVGNYRVEGSDATRVNAKLLDAKTGKTILSQNLDIKAGGRLESEKIVALRLARAIYRRLAEIEDESFLTTQNISDEAKKNYLAGQTILRNYEFNRWKEGVGVFKKVTELEPDWSKGHAKYAEALVILHGGLAERLEIKRAVDKALEMNADLWEPHLAKGWYHILGSEWNKAEDSFRRAIKINPDYAIAHHELATVQDFQRKFSQAKKNYGSALSINPFEPFFLSSLCKHLHFDKKIKSAIQACKEALAIDPKHGLAPKLLFWLYVDNQNYQDAFNIEFGDLKPEEVKNNKAATSFRKGDIKHYLELRIKDRLSNKKRRHSPFAVAHFYARLQNKEQTLQYLEETAEKFGYDFWFVNPDPVFDFLRSEPRFQKLVKQFNMVAK